MKFGLTFRSNDKVLLSLFIEKLRNTWLELNNDKKDLSIVGLPIKTNRFTILRSPHVDKKSRDQWEIRKYSYYCVLKNKHIKEIELLINYMLKHAPGGIGIVIHRYQKINV